jgi:hypothetical protein
MPDWTTRIDPELSRPFGVEEVHTVWFTPPGWPGKGAVVGLGIPECELQVVWLDADEQPVAMVNRPQQNRRLKGWIRTACDIAKEWKAVLTLTCDTPEQAELAAKRAARLLPGYRRVALERMAKTVSRTDEGLH